MIEREYLISILPDPEKILLRKTRSKNSQIRQECKSNDIKYSPRILTVN